MSVFCILPWVGLIGLVASFVLTLNTPTYRRRDVVGCAGFYVSVWLICTGAACK